MWWAAVCCFTAVTQRQMCAEVICWAVLTCWGILWGGMQVLSFMCFLWCEQRPLLRRSTNWPHHIFDEKPRVNFYLKPSTVLTFTEADSVASRLPDPRDTQSLTHISTRSHVCTGSLSSPRGSVISQIYCFKRFHVWSVETVQVRLVRWFPSLINRTGQNKPNQTNLFLWCERCPGTDLW